MTDKNEMTREELNAFRYHRTKIEYTQSEGMDLVNLVRKFINDRQASCFSCGNALREAKTAANEFLAAFGPEIEARLISEETIQPEIIQEIKPITNGKKGKNR